MLVCTEKGTTHLEPMKLSSCCYSAAAPAGVQSARDLLFSTVPKMRNSSAGKAQPKGKLRCEISVV